MTAISLIMMELINNIVRFPIFAMARWWLWWLLGWHTLPSGKDKHRDKSLVKTYFQSLTWLEYVEVHIQRPKIFHFALRQSIQANILLQRSAIEIENSLWSHADNSFQKQDHWKNTEGSSARLRRNIMILLYIVKCHANYLNIWDYDTNKKTITNLFTIFSNDLNSIMPFLPNWLWMRISENTFEWHLAAW